MTTPHSRKSIGWSPLRLGFLLITLVLVCFGLSSTARAVTPAPDGGYPGYNTAEGQNALLNLTIGGGFWNTALGAQALHNDTTGSFNTAVGLNALYFNIDGKQNTAVGTQALQQNTHGIGNVAIGRMALFSNTTGPGNTALGWQALFSNNADLNTAIGSNALFSNTTGDLNTATGAGALQNNTGGTENTANGYQALYLNTTGSLNTATGLAALAQNSTGFNNTATGLAALEVNTIGHDNTATGLSALQNTSGSFNTADGVEALFNNIAGSYNTALGFNAGFNIEGSGNVCIGDSVIGLAGESNITRIRNIGTTAYNTGRYVQVDAAGKLGYVVSSRRYKHEIKPMEKASEALYALKPVTYRYNGDIDPAHAKMFGLIAEEVAEAAPDLVVRNEKGEPETLRFDSINAMLLNEFLKEHQKVRRLEAALAAVNERLKEQDAKIDKVNAKVELTKPASQMAINSQ